MSKFLNENDAIHNSCGFLRSQYYKQIKDDAKMFVGELKDVYDEDTEIDIEDYKIYLLCNYANNAIIYYCDQDIINFCSDADNDKLELEIYAGGCDNDYEKIFEVRAYLAYRHDLTNAIDSLDKD